MYNFRSLDSRCCSLSSIQLETIDTQYSCVLYTKYIKTNALCSIDRLKRGSLFYWQNSNINAKLSSFYFFFFRVVEYCSMFDCLLSRITFDLLSRKSIWLDILKKKIKWNDENWMTIIQRQRVGQSKKKKNKSTYSAQLRQIFAVVVSCYFDRIEIHRTIETACLCVWSFRKKKKNIQRGFIFSVCACPFAIWAPLTQIFYCFIVTFNNFPLFIEIQNESGNEIRILCVCVAK